MNVYGQVLTGADVHNAIEAHLRKWLPSYLKQIGTNAGRELPMLRSYRRSTNDIEHWPEQQIPAGIIVVAGMTETVRQGDGKFNAVFPVGIGIICMARDQDSVNELVQLYTGAMAASIMQHGSLDGFAAGTEWVDVRYDELETSNRRTMAAGALNLRVSMDSVLDSGAGVAHPPLDPNYQTGEVESAETEVNLTAERFDSQQEIII